VRRILSCCISVLVLLAVWPVGASAQLVTGTATYRERIALPPAAIFEAVIQDVSRADAGAPVIGRARFSGIGQPPIRFEIPVDPATIRPDARYGLSARIRLGDRLLFVTDRVVPVLTRGGGTSADLLLRSAAGAPPPDQPRSEPSQPEAELLLAPLPASFEGALPCTDCEAVDWHLDLLPGGAYRLARSHRGKPERSRLDTIGRWRLDAAQRVLRLSGRGGEEMQFSVRDRDALRLRDRQGGEIDSRLNYDLRRRAGFEPIEPRLVLDGMYSYMADAAVITLCATGERLPVATAGDNVALERGYGALRAQPGEAMLVSVEGRIAQRPPMEGSGMRATLVPERFIGAWPRETCAAPEVATDLQETYWRLTRLREAPVEVAPRAREPHLVLRADGRIAGSGGCNRLVGGYMRILEQIDFAGIATTRVACPAGMEQEARFTAALAAAARWRIEGRHLDVFDVGGERILRFEAVALR
jgi:copper homeostasis protein (lipoprotein)